MIGSLLINLVGGIALLLYGFRLSGDGLQGTVGGRLRHLLGLVTKNRLAGAGAGAIAAAILQSSSATTVMLVGFTSTGLLTLPQALTVILGADVGATLTVQLLAFHVLDYALLIVAAGFFLYFLSRTRGGKSVGLAILGFGFIFLGFKLLSDGMAPLKSDERVTHLLVSFSEKPLLGLLTAALLSALLQSSAAAIGIVLAFANQGLLTPLSALPLVLGANLGTSATVLIASLGARAEAKRVAISYTIFKVVGVSIAYFLLPAFFLLVAFTADDVARQIANAHTLFNLALAALHLPLTDLLARLVSRLIVERPHIEEVARPKYLDPVVLDSPPLALGQATREALRMADIVQDMLKDASRVFTEDNQELAEDLEKRDDWVDTLNREIKLYITRLSEQTLSKEQSGREMALLAFINDLENIGDIIDNNLMELAKKKIYKGLRFSDQGLKEIITLHEMVAQNFELVISAFASQDEELAHRVIKDKARINQKERELRQAHIHRLHEGLPETIETSAIHLDVLTSLRRINSHVTSIAYPIIEQ